MAEVFLARYAGPEGFEKQLVIKRVLPQISESPHLLADVLRGGEDAGVALARQPGVGVRLRAGRQRLLHRHGLRARRRSRVAVRRRSRRRPAARRASLLAHVGVEICRGLAYVHAPRLRASRRDAAQRAAVGGRRGEAVRLRARASPCRARSRPGGPARPATWRPSRRAAIASTRAPISTRSALILAEGLLGRSPRADPDGAGASTEMSSPMSSPTSRHTARWARSWPARSQPRPSIASPARPRCSPRSRPRSAASAPGGKRSSASWRRRSTGSRPTRKRLRRGSPRAATVPTAVDGGADARELLSRSPIAGVRRQHARAVAGRGRRRAWARSAGARPSRAARR